MVNCECVRNTNQRLWRKVQAKQQEGYDDVKAGRVQDVTTTFAKFRESCWHEAA
jgi:hypothetical protein